MKYKKIGESVVEYIITRDLRELSGLTRYRIADHFGLNKNYLSEKFKEETQMTVRQYLDFEKMKRAEGLLRTKPDLSIRKIADLVGIEKLCQFRVKFKKAYHMSPGRYRRLIKK
jgi:two-component system, response regulator YesN